jgi:aminoacrylate hydrolase
MAYVEDGDASLYYEDSGGTADAVIFVPGFGGVGSFWNGQREYFRSTLRVLTVDHRGSGSSSKTNDNYSIEQMARDVILVMDHAEISKANIVGHSTGGVIAQYIAATWPDRVSKLVLSSTWCRPGRYFCRVFQFRRSLLQRGDVDGYHKAGVFFQYQPEFLEDNDDMFESKGGIDVDNLIRRIDAVLDSDIQSLSKTIKSPTLIVAAEDDHLVPRFLSDDVARIIEGSTYKALRSGGHFHPKTKASQFNSVISMFF